MRFGISETYVEGFGDCFKLLDDEGKFGEWYSLSEMDLKHLVDFLNEQEDSINNLISRIHDKNEAILELGDTILELKTKLEEKE